MAKTESISDEKIAEMLAGLEGVTPGPWHSTFIRGGYHSEVRDVQGEALASDSGCYAHESNEERIKNSAHIARCDPDTIRALITELQTLRSAPSGEPVGWLHFDSECEMTFNGIEAAIERLDPVPGENLRLYAALRASNSDGRVEPWTDGELLPCPFCGSSGDELMMFCDPSEGIDNSGPSRRVQCAGCNVEAPFYDTKDEAIWAWNRRYPNDPLRWHEGEPPKHLREEWFIASLVGGGRVVLRALPEEWTFDYTTQDDTFYKADRIKKWMQFPDSEFIPYNPPDKALDGIAVTDEMVERMCRWMATNAGEDPDVLIPAGNPIGEYAEYPAWMLYQLQARTALTAALKAKP